MNRLVPKSLFGQTLLILLAGLIVSHLIGSWIYTADREQAVRVVGGFSAAQRIANLTRLVQDAPLEWRERIVSALSDQSLRVSLQSRPPAFAGANADGGISDVIKEFLVDQVPTDSARQIRVAVSASPDSSLVNRHHWGRGPMMGPGSMMGHGPMRGRGPMMHRLGGFRDLEVAMPLPDGQWLSFATSFPDTGPAFSRQFLVSMAVMAIIIVGVTILVVRRVTAPLASLAVAAERLGRDVAAPPLPETGTIETRKASRAFNEMQVRLRGLIESRTRLLAAISHDLRTPLTLLRLRTETIGDQQERGKMLATIAEMNSLVEEALTFARDESVAEPACPTDLTSLVQSITDDMRDAGLPVTMEPAQTLVHECRPTALKRALINLIDNALKYGKSAHTTVRAAPKGVEITIDDEGPGIPESQLKRVLEPFYRLDESRSRETGGVGLGLAIALSAIQAQGGELLLSNRPAGGLRAMVRLVR
jgi:signal transduction histidine kinase